MATSFRSLIALSFCVIVTSIACSAGDRLPSGNGNGADGGTNSDGAGGGASEGNDGGLNVGAGPGNDVDVNDNKDVPAAPNCGDGVLDEDEACDDGNEMSGDGCADTCRQVEDGFVCPTEGEPCRAYAKCGDGAVIFPEQCDDGNLDENDGCNELCKVEIGYKCEGSPSVCTETVCGDGVKEGAETCDDGNSIPFDGCSEICQGEPNCSGEGSGCSSGCGDGLMIGEEECDDGNAISGDGCSENCKKEEGYVCRQEPACPEDDPDCPLELPIVFRDFNMSHSDFHPPEPPDNPMCDGSALGMVAETLDAEGKPSFLSAPASACVSNFGDWYVDSGQSSTIVSDITLYPTGSGEYVNRYGEDGEPYVTTVDTGNELQGFGATLAACESSCAQRARDGQEPFEGQGHLRCDDLCRDIQQQANQLRDNELNQANNQLTQAENADEPDEELIAELEEEIAAIEDQIAALEEEADTCVSDCEAELAERTATCADQCAPCSNNADQYCIGGEELELDGNPLFFPIDGHPNALTPQADYGAARIPAQIYMGAGWPWEGGECDGDWQTCDGPKHNFHFTSEIAYWFEYKQGETALDLRFIGDDDVWVFVNGQLVIDLGGIHVPLAGQFTLSANGDVELSTWEPPDPGEDDVLEDTPISNGTTSANALGLMDGGVYDIKVFHAERKPEGSSFQLTLSGFNAPRSECTSICGDGILAAGEQCDEGEENNTGGHNGCNPDCTLGGFCGDGIVQEGVEECDDNDPNAPADCAGCRRIVVR